MRLISALKRFWLRQRIDMLRADIAVAVERRDNACITIASADHFIAAAHKRLRQLKANLAAIERPETLLAEALRHGE